MKTYLIDKNNIYTYESLLVQINNVNSYYPTYKTNILYDYFFNLIISLLSGNPITLIDSDISTHELNQFGITGLNISKEIALKNYNDFSDVIKDIQKSESKVTIFTSGTTGQPKKVIHSVQPLS